MKIAKMPESKVGLFPVCYEIGVPTKTGSPVCHARLLVNAPNETVSGMAEVTQVTSPPFPHFYFNIGGTFTYLCTMDTCHILIVASGEGLTCGTKFEMRIVVANDWQSGTGQFKYFHDGQWTEVNDAQVQAVPCYTQKPDGE